MFADGSSICFKGWAPMANPSVGHEQSHKSHRSRQSGPSAKKKGKNSKKRDVSEEKKQNPKVGYLLLILCLSKFRVLWGKFLEDHLDVFQLVGC